MSLILTSRNRFIPPRLGQCAWLKADAEGSVITSGGNVTNWIDLGDNNYDFIPSGNAPSLSASTLNGKPVVHFDRSNSESMSAGNLSIAGSGGHTIYVVVRGVAANSSQMIISKTFGGTSGSAYLNLVTAGTVARYVCINSAPLAEIQDHSLATPASWHIITARFDNDGLEMWINGDLQIPGGALAGPLQVSTSELMLGNNDGGSAYLDGDIAELILTFSAHTSDQVATMNKYLEDQWGL